MAAQGVSPYRTYMAATSSSQRTQDQPVCPRCQQPMTASERAPKRPDLLIGYESGARAPLSLPVWRCPQCGIDRARF
jgi:hypothetical protein